MLLTGAGCLLTAAATSVADGLPADQLQLPAGKRRKTQMRRMQVVLLGDSSHTMTPQMGQGCACGLEDVSVLQQVQNLTPCPLQLG